eukprot:augustus_masked-scaffold_14-processed-gene-7.14-mRNA-1 protein AED:1.00 eAED:1.00 QI:0/0/0/0/1/1/2/0/300
MRYNVCSGFGHKAAECPTTERRCGLCGTKDHLARECKSKKKVSLAVLAASLAEGENSEKNSTSEPSEEEGNEEESEEDTSEVEEVSIGALRYTPISSKSVKDAVPNSICYSATASEKVCSCSLSTSCLRIPLPHKPNDKRNPANDLYATSAENFLQHYRPIHVSGNRLSRIGYKFDTNACTLCGESQIRTNRHREEILKKDFTSFVAVASGEKLCCDIIGPFTPREICQNRYTFVVIYPFSRFSWVFPVKSKDVTKSRLFSLIKCLTKEYKTVKCIMLEQGSEFKNPVITRFLDERGIVQ